MMRRLRVALALAGGLLAATAAAQPRSPEARLAEGRVIVALSAAPTGLDPHVFAGNADSTVHANFYEGLVRLSHDGKVTPALATGWTVADGLTWDFVLREGVVFHDGAPFGAEDAAASIRRAMELKTSMFGPGVKLRPITSIEVTGPHGLRLRTDRPTPILLPDLGKVPILRRSALGVTEPEALNTLREAVGTGPFRVVGYTPETTVELARHDGWWGGLPAWRSAAVRIIPRDAIRMAALLAGDIDVIERVTPNDATALATRPGFALSSAPGAASAYVIPALGREDGGPYVTSPGGGALAANPFRDRRVRQAMSLAVSRTALTDRLLAGNGLPAAQVAPVGSPHHVDGIAAPAQDIAAGRALLAEAGYADGFRFTLVGPSDRYAGITQVAEALAQMWSRVGLAAQVETVPSATLSRRAPRGEFGAMLFVCCASTVDTLATTRDLLATPDPVRGLGASNYGRFSSPALDRVLLEGLASFDPAEQARARREAALLVAEEVPIIQLYHPLNTWATRSPLRYAPRLDGQTPVLGVLREGPVLPDPNRTVPNARP